MIQRIQTVYLLLSILLLCTMLYIPLGSIPSVKAIYFIHGYEFEEKFIQYNYLNIAFFLLSLLVELFAILSFKNRVRQLRVVQIALVLLLFLVVSVLLSPDYVSIRSFSYSPDNRLELNWFVLGLALPWILNFLALRAIRKDEALVRSADRLR